MFKQSHLLSILFLTALTTGCSDKAESPKQESHAKVEKTAQTKTPTSQAKCDVDYPVVFSGLDWDSNAFHVAVAQFILEKGYQCKTDIIPGSETPLLNGLKRGDTHITMEVWVDNVLDIWKKGLSEGYYADMGSNFNDAKQAWFIPKYLVEGENAPAKDLKSVADLNKYKELFKDPESPEKGRFYNCLAGWTCETVNNKKLIAYNLTDTFVNFRPGTNAALNAAIDSNLKRKKPIFFYYWTPSWIMGKYGDQLIELKEPEFNETTWKALQEQDKPTQATAYPKGDVRIGTNGQFAKEAPQIIAFLKNYETSSAQVSVALSYMQANNASVEETAQHFLKNNQAQWSVWVPEDVAKRVLAALK